MMVENRFRAASLYDEAEPTAFLWVRVLVVGRAFGFVLRYSRRLHDPLADISGWADTWGYVNVGTHGNSAEGVLQALSEQIDRFMLEYRRVNEPWCLRD